MVVTILSKRKSYSIVEGSTSVWIVSVSYNPQSAPIDVCFDEIGLALGFIHRVHDDEEFLRSVVASSQK